MSARSQVERSMSCVGMAGVTPPECTDALATQDSYSPDDGEALLEETLEEENLEDANLVEVEVKAEQ
ncbi:hypothetical protein LR48_Vigan543s001500 [Vigna angularis]|uniref:Uncharacterized protein n=1 Tax=Phaseolus angularis TaxID=3914 RepID=A0A0L9TD27_PHAAN|nr:hypothetical protein LR48_Vigan543s001500 [Vigna angularis]